MAASRALLCTSGRNLNKQWSLFTGQQDLICKDSRPGLGTLLYHTWLC